MTAIDAIATIGELMSWIGLIAGMPLLVIAGMIRLADGGYAQVDVSIVDGFEDRSFALWSSGGRTCSRVLNAHEHSAHADATSVAGYASVRDPERMRFERMSPAVRVCLIVAAVMLGSALIGFVVSLLPLVG